MVNVKPVKKDYFPMGKEIPVYIAMQMKYWYLGTNVRNVQLVKFRLRVVNIANPVRKVWLPMEVSANYVKILEKSKS